jgi:hypothetical protein
MLNFFTLLEKLAEAQRKFENLKNDLTNTFNFLERKNLKNKKNVELVVEVQEKDDEDAENTKALLGNKDYTDQEVAKKSDRSQNIARRLIEKNKERQLKQKTFRKEHELKLAFSEFYLSLILLQNYQTLNHTGFRKILKKHDKVKLFLF